MGCSLSFVRQLRAKVRRWRPPFSQERGAPRWKPAAAALLFGALMTQACLNASILAQATVPFARANATSSAAPGTSGTWAMLQVSKLSALKYFKPQIDSALAI